MQTKDHNKKEKIIASVARTIVEDGIENVSISKTATRAGISKGTVYIYFKNKQALLRETYLAMRQHYNDYLLDHVDRSGDSVSQLSSFITSLYQFGHHFPIDILVIDAVVCSHLRNDFFSTGKEPPVMLDPWNDIINTGVTNGTFRQVDGYAANFYIFHAVSSYLKDLFYHNLTTDDFPFETLRQLIMNSFLIR